MVKPQKIDDLLAKKQKIEKEIQILQKECKHSEKTIKSIRENVDSTTFIIRWVCNKCSSVVGIPSKDEINKFLN